MSYMTRQQQAVLQCIEASPDGRATAMELMQRLRQSGQTVGLSTVYRQLEQLRQLRCTYAVGAAAYAGQHRLLLFCHIGHETPPEFENENHFQIITKIIGLSTIFFPPRMLQYFHKAFPLRRGPRN